MHLRVTIGWGMFTLNPADAVGLTGVSSTSGVGSFSFTIDATLHHQECLRLLVLEKSIHAEIVDQQVKHELLVLVLFRRR